MVSVLDVRWNFQLFYSSHEPVRGFRNLQLHWGHTLGSLFAHPEGKVRSLTWLWQKTHLPTTIIKSHDAKQHASIGENVSALVTIDLQQLYQRVNWALSLVHCSRSPLILHQNKHYATALSNWMTTENKQISDMGCLASKQYGFTVHTKWSYKLLQNWIILV